MSQLVLQTHPDGIRAEPTLRNGPGVVEDLRLAEGLADLGDLLGSEADLREYLHSVSEAAEGIVDVAAVGCSLADRRGELQVAAWTSDEVRDLERLELQDCQGPGVDCYATGQPVVNIGRVRARRRWPTLSTKLVEAGFRSMHALPLHIDGHAIGVVTLYTVQRRRLRTAELSICRKSLQAAGVRLRQASPSARGGRGLRPLGERYQVSELIGSGGMAEVHLARDVTLDREVAIKTPRTDLISEPGVIERFRQEARSVAGLDHPSIISVLSAGYSEVTDPHGDPVRRPYIVMEHVAGVTLRKLVGAGAALSIDEALRITADIASALEYSHEQGVMHGDLTATNVMLSTGGDVKLIDFGSSSRVVTDADATTPQTVYANPHYASPERVQRLAFDTRSDLYSAGCLLYELLTGRTPFVGKSPVDLTSQHVHAAPEPPSTHSPHIGARLDAVVLRALAKGPDARYQGAQQFRRDLLAARSDSSPSIFELGAA